MGLCRTNRISCDTLNVPRKQEIMTLETTLESDIGTYDVNDVSKLSLWEATGHIEYHVTHSKFLGSRLIRQQH